MDQSTKESAKSILLSILKFANSEDMSDNIPEFIKFTKYLDGKRNQNIVDIAPQYKRLFNE